MKHANFLIAVAAILTAAAVGCQSGHEIQSDSMSQWTYVAATPAATAHAAKAVLNDMGLGNVQASSSEIDGSASGVYADGRVIHVNIMKNDAGSRLEVAVGAGGDRSLGTMIVERIRDKAEGK